MKKLLVILLLIVSIYFLSKKEYDISNGEIRFRVIAASNSALDILMKEKVVNELASTLFINGNKEKIKNNIINNLSTIDNKIDKLFKESNYDKKYSVSYGLNEFPKKTYKGKTYKAGNYESLVVKIGSASGNNYWCFLYPALCLTEEDNNDNNSLDKEEKVIKFKFIEVLKKILNN